MKDGDLVTVVREPERPATVYVGRLGLVDGVPLNGRALVHFIDPAGEPGSAAYLPVDCLEPTSNPAHEARLARYRQSVAATDRAIAEWRQQRRRDIEKVAIKHGMTVGQVLEITKAVVGEDANIYF